MNTKQQGDIGVAMAIAYYTAQGCVVCPPLTDNARYDLVIDRDGKLFRVQCKCTSYWADGTPVVALRTNGGNRSGIGMTRKISADECDELFVHVLGQCSYVFPPDVFDGKTAMRLGKVYEQYKI